MSNTQILETAQRIASERLVTSKAGRPCPRRDSHPNYLSKWQDNLIEGVTAADCEADLRRGDGSELDDREWRRTGKQIPAKFCAPHSSSALAVNCFGPFRHGVKLPSFAGLGGIGGIGGIGKVEFGYPCNNGLRTKRHPNFDLYLQSDDGAVVAVESKFLEPLGSKKVEFKPQYDGPFRGAGGRPISVEEPWRAVFEELKTGRLKYDYLDAAQLVKHYLGLKVKYHDRARCLLYVFWEPSNAIDCKEFVTHREEVADLSDRVTGCDTQFRSISYPGLWREWQSTSTWLGMNTHVARLQERYSFPLRVPHR
jgi:hypothetical protein